LKRLNKEEYHLLRVKGLCVQCGNPVEDGKARCKSCRIYNANAARKSYMKKAGKDV
jgi:hypothetical protein